MNMKIEFSSRRKSDMRNTLDGAQCDHKREVVWLRPLTLRQQLYSFFAARDEGSQLLEMAVVAPMLLVILTGMASFGMALYSQQQLGLAAANAVQAVATGASYVTNPCSTMEADVMAGLPNWTAANMTYTITITMVTSGTTTTQTDSWTGTSYPADCTTTDLNDLTSTPAQFQPLTLKLTYPYSWFPIMQWGKNGSTFKPSGNLSSTQAAMIQ
jgi:Flp pilus assembly protein TadG